MVGSQNLVPSLYPQVPLISNCFVRSLPSHQWCDLDTWKDLHRSRLPKSEFSKQLKLGDHSRLDNIILWNSSGCPHSELKYNTLSTPSWDKYTMFLRLQLLRFFAYSYAALIYSSSLTQHLWESFKHARANKKLLKSISLSQEVLVCKKDVSGVWQIGSDHISSTAHLVSSLLKFNEICHLCACHS